MQKKNPETIPFIDRFLLHLQRSPHAARFSLGTNGWVGRYIYIKGVTERFDFDDRRISQIHRLVKNKATGTPQGCFICKPFVCLTLKTQEGELYIDIGVGLSTLLVSTNRAMREPFYRGTSDRTGSTFFCVYKNRYRYERRTPPGADGSMKSNSAMKLKENSTIKIITGGEAKVLKELGAGGQGTVYKVHYGGKDYA